MEMEEEADEAPKTFETREYQTLLLEEAKNSNVVLYLPTGSGKTYIAQMLIQHFGHELVKPFSQGGKRSFFLCTTQALLYQQGKVLQRNLPYSVGYFTGADAVDYWSDETWNQVLDKYQVIAFTAQILLNLLSTNRIQFRQISVMIFDECHHVEAGHPMKQITDLYANQFRAGLCQTRLMGLTATLLNSDVKGKMLRRSDLNNQVAALERAFCGRVISSNTAEVTRWSTNPDEEFQYYPSEDPHPVVQKLLLEMEPYFEIFSEENLAGLKAALLPDEFTQPKIMAQGDIAFPIIKKPSILKDLKVMHDEIQTQFRLHGLNAGNIAALIMMLAAFRENLAADLELVAHLLETALTSFSVVRQKAEAILQIYKKDRRYLQYNSPKINCLLKLLKDYPPDRRTLIFCQRRATVKVLYYIIRKVAQHVPGYESIKPDFMVGVSTHLVQNTKLAEFTKKQDKQVMYNFNKGHTNVLVATDVLEEGIDIQSCNMVIKFDPPQHTRSYVQSKGRARSHGSQYIVMVNEKDKRKYEEQFAGFLKIEEALKAISREKRLNLDHLDAAYYRKLPGDKDQTNIYYVDGLESASVSEAGAPPLLYQYCNTLKYDNYSNIAPSIFKVVKNDEIKVVLRMPINCPIYEEIHGDWVKDGLETVKYAFQNASFKAVKLLHQIGELNEELRPTNKLKDPCDDKEWFPNYEELDSIEEPSNLVGTKRRRELYPISSPTCLAGTPSGGPDEPCYLHAIVFHPKFHPSLVDTDRKKVYTQYLASGESYAIITRRTLSRIAEFPVYERLGEMVVSVAVNTALTLSKAELASLRKFQTYLFRQVLPDAVKSFMMPLGPTKDSSSNVFIVAPIIPQPGNKGYDINWHLVNHVQSLPLVTEEEPSVAARKERTFNPMDYEHKVVIPWHRHNAKCQPYVVTAISPLTSSAPFPESSLTYATYYLEKYEITMYHENPFMLDVKPVSSTINYLSPRTTKDKRKRKVDGTTDIEYEEVLPPELCNVVNFPAAYWIAGTFLPSALYRINALLNADQLRTQIALKSGIVQLHNLKHDDSFAPLRKSTEIHLSGKKKTYTPLDPKSKARSDTIDRIRSNQCVDVLALDLHELKLDVVAEESGEELLDEDMYKKLTSWNLEKDMDELTIFDIVLNERKMNKVNIPLFTKATQAAEVCKKVEVKPYELNFESAPQLNVLDIQYDAQTCRGPSQRDIYEALTAHSVQDIVNYERLETLGDSLLKFASTLALYTALRTMDEGQLTQAKNYVVGNRNLYLAARRLGLPSYIKIHEFAPLHDWTPPGFGLPEDIKTIFNAGDLPPSLLLDIDLRNETLVNGKLSAAAEAKVMSYLSNLDDDAYTDPTDMELEDKPVARLDEQNMPFSTYNFLDRIKLNDKVVADVVESLTGAYLSSCGIEGAMMFLQSLDILPEDKVDIGNILYGKNPSALRSPEARTIDPLRLIPLCDTLEERIHYKFQDKTFLLEALSHPTYNANRVTGSYQRMEFLGDAIIDFLVTVYLYENFTHLSPGDISDIRSAMVNNVTFASYSVRLGLHRLMLYDSPKLLENMSNFAQNQEAKNHMISDEIFFLIEESEVENDIHGRTAEHVDVPKALGDVFEALIGAVYIDSGKDLSRVWYLLYNIMKKELDAFTREVPKNAIRLLHELQCWPEFGNAKTLSGRSIVPLSVMIGRNHTRRNFFGVGLNKKNAKMAAAKMALRYIE
uniref:Endoribonuclease Dicer n=1 Tax=Cacopsylla melanoneura TaxID=428564 RepID=A0A8D8W370_9HEMI